MNKRAVSLLVIGIMLFGFAQPVFAAFALQSKTADLSWFKPGDEVVIRLKDASVKGLKASDAISTLKSQASVTKIGILSGLKKLNVEVINGFWITNALLVRVNDLASLKAIVALPEVDHVVPNFVVTSPKPTVSKNIIPNVEDVTWGIAKIEAPQVWSMGYTGSGVTVCVIDTGVDITHPDLQGKLYTTDAGDAHYPGGWIEFDSSGLIITDSTPYDEFGHGTHVSGTIAGGDASGVQIGVAPGATLMHSLSLPGGGGTFAQCLAGMQWAIAPTDRAGNPTGHPADVVSMSWGAGGYYSEFIAPIENTWAAGIVPVAAIGNNWADTSISPGNVYDTLSVGATDSDDYVADFSSGEVVYKSWWTSPPAGWPTSWVKPDISAPGVSVYSSVPGGGYEYWDGTSMATPHVAASSALLIQMHPDWTVSDVWDTLALSAVDLGAQGKDTRYGSGRLDVFLAAGGEPGDPAIAVTPTSVEIQLPSNYQDEANPLEIQNVGGSVLTWTIYDEVVQAPETNTELNSASTSKPADYKAIKATNHITTTSTVLLLVDVLPWGGQFSDNEVLLELGIPYDVASSTEFTTMNLSSYEVIVISSDQPQSFYDNMATNQPKLESWVASGGTLEAHATDWGWNDGIWTDILPGHVLHNVGSDYVSQQNYIVDASHPITQGITDSQLYYWNYVSHGDFYDLAPNTHVIIKNDYDTPTLIEYPWGDGKVVATMMTLEWAWWYGYCPDLLWNVMIYCCGMGHKPAGDATWLTESPSEGNTSPGLTRSVTLSVDTTGLQKGDYYANIVIGNNDPQNPLVTVPVHLVVTDCATISVEPVAIAKQVNPGEKVTSPLTISNTGLVDLTYTVSILYADNAQKAAAARKQFISSHKLPAINGGGWVTVSSEEGTVAPSGSDALTVTLSSTNFDPATYHYAELEIVSNDPFNPIVSVPIDLYVRPGKPIATDPQEGRDPDIKTLYEILTPDAIVLSTELYQGYGQTAVVITGLDTDLNKATGCTRKDFNDIGADYMIYALVAPPYVNRLTKPDLSAYVKQFPGVKFSQMDAGYYYLYKWEQSSKTWSYVFNGPAWFANEGYGFGFWVPMLLLNSDGQMYVTQETGTMMSMFDIIPDSGHASTVSNRDISVDSLTYGGTQGWTDVATPLFATVTNKGDMPETFNVTFTAVNNGPAPKANPPVAKPFAGVVVTLLPYGETTVVVDWIPKKSGAYTLTASVAAIKGESDTTNNKASVDYNVYCSHDIAVVGMTTSDPNPYKGGPTTVLVEVANLGILDETGVKVELYSGKTLVGSTTVDVPAGEAEQASVVIAPVSWTPKDAGDIALNAKASAVSGEDDATNNEYSKTFTVANGHDLTVTAVTSVLADPVQGPDINSGEEVDVTATIKNNGGQDEQYFTVQLLVDGVEYSSSTFETLVTPGNSVGVIFTWVAGPTGSRKLTVKAIQPLDLTPADNSKDLTVKVMDHDIKVTATYAGTPKKDKATTLTVTVQNLGTYDEKNVDVWFSDGVSAAMKKTIALVKAGAKATTTFSWTPKAIRSYTLTAYSTLSSDINPGDNTWTTTVSVISQKLKLVVEAPATVQANSVTTIKIHLVDETGDYKMAGYVIQLTCTNGKLSTTKVVTDENGYATVTLTAPNRITKLVISAKLVAINKVATARISVRR